MVIKEAPIRKAATDQSQPFNPELDIRLLVTVKRGLENRYKVGEREIAMALKTSTFEYDDVRAHHTAREILEAFADPSKVLGQGIQKADRLVREAVLLHDGLSERVRESVLGTFSKEVAARINRAIHGEEEQDRYSITGIIDNFDGIVDGKAGRYRDYTMRFTLSAQESFRKGIMAEGNDKNGEYHRLAEALPRLKYGPFDDMTKQQTASTGRGVMKSRPKTVVDGREYTTYHAGANRRTLRADYVVNENHEVIITDIYFLH